MREQLHDLAGEIEQAKSYMEKMCTKANVVAEDHGRDTKKAVHQIRQW